MDEAQKLQHYRTGRYAFPVPPVCTVRWTEADWVRYIDHCGVWL